MAQGIGCDLMAKVYTKTGDSGTTRLNYGEVSKDSAVIRAVGAFDELQSALDMVRLYCPKEHHEFICKVQDKLRMLAGIVVDAPAENVTKEEIKEFEDFVDKYAHNVPNKFIRFNKQSSVYMNEARVRVRTLERTLVPLRHAGKVSSDVYVYVNRLSDVLFVLCYKLENDKAE